MKTLIKTKLLEGKYCELREYEMFKVPLKVIHCKAKEYKLCPHEKEGYMTFTVEQQRKGKVTNTQKSKFYPYSYYRLYKFLWKPRLAVFDVVEERVSTFNAMSKMVETPEWERARRKLHE